MTTKRDDIMTSIAREVLDIPTLDTRRSDSLDFHDIAVWRVKEALERAFEAGQRDTGPRRFECPACGRTIDIKTIK